MAKINICNYIDKSNNFFHPSSECGEIFISECIDSDSKGTVIIIPPYGRTVHDLFLIAAYLVINKFSVIRFDSRDHVGMSTGNINNYKLSTIEKDLMDVLSLSSIDQTKPIILVGISLSAPVAWKVASQVVDNISGIVTLVGAVDVVSTIERAGNISLSPYINKSEQHLDLYQEVLGLKVITQPFVDDLMHNQYMGKEKIKHYIASAACPVYMIAAKNDSWVLLDDVNEVIDLSNKKREMLLLDNVDHEIGKSAVSAKFATTTLVSYCNKIVGDVTEIIVPKLTEIITASTLESERFNQFTSLKRDPLLTTI